MASELNRLFEVCRFAELQNRPDSFLEEFVHNIRKALNSGYCEAVLYDKNSDEPYYRFGNGRGDNFIGEKLAELFRIKTGEIEGKKKRSLNLTEKNIPDDMRIMFKGALAIPVKNMLAVPMLSRGEVTGIIAAVNKRGSLKFSADDEKLICIYAAQVSLMIENSLLFEENKNKEKLSHLGQSIVNSAHYLKNLLNNLDGGSYIVELGTQRKNMNDVNKGWDIIKRNSNRVRDLVLDILMFSRPKQPEYKLTDINIICRDIKELIEENAKENNIQINLDLDCSIEKYRLDPKGVYRCILNLVSNALFSCREKGGGEISIKTNTDEQGNLKIIIADTGMGISKGNLDHIFDIFFTTKGSQGTGLGLAVTKKIIDEHAGSITVISEPGTGTSFTITLPKSKTHLEMSPPE